MKPGPVKAIYPGSFDPLTNGHVDILQRGTQLFDTVIPAILINYEKTAFFTPEERMHMIREAVGDLPGVAEPIYFDGLTVDAARRHGATVIVRGIRAVSDYEYELQMSLMNRSLAPEVETVLLVPAQEYSFISSRLVKDIFQRGGDIRDLVPEGVRAMLRTKFPRPEV
ncbi:MAG: pantetheine-phosphate adenylyltransferase [Acidobacteria bacterium]|nr:pantetheine-phosphate adenylyltransferase [Acidobacteriota bacterium]